MDHLSWLHNMSLKEIEEKYQNYLQDKNSVDPQWLKFFEGFEFARNSYSEEEQTHSVISSEFAVIELIQDYRKRGHYFTETNPVRKRRTYTPDLSLSNYGLSEHDLDKEFAAGNEIGLGKTSLRNIIGHLRETYCRSVGVEFMYIRLPNIVEWLRERMESVRNRPSFSADEKKILLKHLAESVYFEKFLQKRFPGQKRFSLEGAENFIPAVHTMIDHASQAGVTDFVFGMAHRGRLNMLANVMHKPVSQIFGEFEGKEFEQEYLLGDVKYHLGHSCQKALSQGRKAQLILAPNPSHLEAVAPIVQGMARSLVDGYHAGFNRVLPVVIHGDASVSGQGVVYEQIQMSELPAHTAGGTIHIVINNQIGFTTDYLEGRSSIYCTDVAKVIQSPIFHVNGDDAEAVAYVMKLAVDYRMKFHKDVFVDLLCYRRHGHNESDEPKYTQPLLYKAIEAHDDPLKIYAAQLMNESVIDEDFLNSIQADYFKVMDAYLEESRQTDKVHLEIFLEDYWKGFERVDEESAVISVDTSVDMDVLLELGRKINSIPPGMKVYSKLQRLLDSRLSMLENDSLDWALAEQLAFATLLNEGSQVRFCGQDVERGTFSQRHAVFTFEETGEKYLPLNNIRDGQGKFEIFNSLLSEYAVLGFEYGYAFFRPHDLTVWEAQFGDFANGAQIVIDQFIASAEEKWGVMNNLIMFLPHGYEGQGPEHSSARIERFLNLCANYNMDVIQCTTPANMFHAIRRHLKRSWRKPMVMFTPKSLLRHPACVSSLADFTSAQFKMVIDDQHVNPSKVRHVVLCSGRVYYDIFNSRMERSAMEMAIIRLEQLYPLDIEMLKSVIGKYPLCEKYTWVQDEPANMGPWGFLSKWLRPMGFALVSRPFSSSPASGSFELHKQRKLKIIEKLFGDCVCERKNKECKMICLGSTPENIQL